MKEPFIFAPFGYGPRNVMCRADGSYRKLTAYEHLMFWLFKKLPRDKFTRSALL